jgi:anti-sigma factor ChrR (cupin superfamily)
MNLRLEGVTAIEWRSVAPQPIFPGVAGIRKRVLWTDPNGLKAMIVEIDAGACFPVLDVHEPGPEEVFVLSGTFNDGQDEYPAGTFIHNPAGSAHLPQSRTGCVLFLVFPAG